MDRLTKTKGEIIKKANELPTQYEAKYKGYAGCTLMAVIDALRWVARKLKLDFCSPIA